MGMIIDSETQLEIIAWNIRNAIRGCRANHVHGMSIENLRQITDTDGVNVPVNAYGRFFDKAARKVAREMRFELLANNRESVS